MSFEAYFSELARVAYEEWHREAIARAVEKYFQRRLSSLAKLKVEEWARELRESRRAYIGRLEELVREAVEAMEEQGMVVHEAPTAKEACELVYEKLGGEKLLVKVKSLTSEEVGLNEYLEERGVEVWETDVGAIILQLLKWRPSHPTGVSITVPRGLAAEAYSKLAGRRLPDSPSALVSFTRGLVREKVLRAKVGFTGANAIAADVGLVYVLTNEANDRLVTTLPDRLIVMAGIEKVMPDRWACELYSKVIPVYATGGGYVTFMSTIGLSKSSDIERVVVAPASGPREVHVILLDNGRREMLRDPVFRDALVCIKCGGCLYFCPVWNVVAGFFSSEGPYMGGFGAPWTLFTRGVEKAALQAYACTLCGRCKDVCPLGVDVPKMVLRVREVAASKGIMPAKLREMANSIAERGEPF
ncbi:MAG: LUD domain-containing protein [Candidatus Nezhaarchaeota archaeon]|nr:LUD domain-containing protein [Candidatus Nezhaarchaeota archaeon]